MKAKKKSKPKNSAPTTLKGWQQIGGFLGQTPSVAKHWADEGMPVRKEGRYVVTTVDELNAWLSRESGKPVRAATEETDLAAELKRGLSYVRSKKSSRKR